MDKGLPEASPESSGLLSEIVHEQETINAFGESGKIFHFAGLGELAAWQIAFKYEWIQIGSSRVNGRGEARTACSDYNDVFDFVGHVNLKRLNFEGQLWDGNKPMLWQ